MENEVQVGDLLRDVEEGSHRVADAAGDQKPEPRRGHDLVQVSHSEDDEPAEYDVDQGGEPLGLAFPQEALDDDADEGDGPDHDAEREAAALGERHEREGGVAPRDKQVDAAVVEDAEHALGSLGCNGMIEGRE